MLTGVTQTDDVHVIHLSNGRANVLSVRNGMMAKFLTALEAAFAAPSCKAIVIAGAGRMFCGGADLKDLPVAGELRGIFDSIEKATKPVVMAIHGLVLGGGVEFALAGQSRIAHSQARFSLPEVNMGLLPGLGGTQRLPRLVGAEAALDMMLTGKMIDADEALAMGLVDQVVDGDVIEAAVAFVRNATLTYRRTDHMAPPLDLADALKRHRDQACSRLNQAHQLILDSVAAISDDFETGVSVEKEKFDIAMKSENAQEALRAFFGKRTNNCNAKPDGCGVT